MRVSTKSWHYWLNSNFNNRLTYFCRTTNVTLCEYFWGTLKSILIAILCVLGCILSAAMVLFGLSVVTALVAFLSTAITGYCFSWVDAEACTVLIGVFGAFALVVGVIVWAAGDMDFSPEYVNKYFRKTKTAILKESKPSLVVEMYKAHKSKWCPLIEIED